MSVPTFTKAGAKATSSASLEKSIFSVDVKNYELLKLAYNAYLANGRQNLAVTKNRGDVSGGGKKPWRQKGTGRARAGDNRLPHWRHGGVAFGPTGIENYAMTLPVKAKRTALRQALSLAAKADNIRVIEAFDAKDAKTAAAASLLAKVEAKGRTLIVLAHKTPELVRATRNLPTASVVTAKYLNVFSLMNADTIVFEKAALDEVSAWLGVAASAARKEQPERRVDSGAPQRSEKTRTVASKAAKEAK